MARFPVRVPASWPVGAVLPGFPIGRGTGEVATLPALGARLLSPGQLSAPLAFTRPQVQAESTGLLGEGTAWRTFAADEPRFAGTRGRLMREGQRTNGLTNPRAQGLPGANPTGWGGLVGTNNGVTRTLTTSFVNGQDVVDVSFSGTGTASAEFVINFEAPTLIPAAQGQSWAQSAFLALLRGDPSVLPITLAMRTINAGGTAISAVAVTSAPNTLAPDIRRYQAVGQLPSVGTAFVQPSLRWPVTAGVSYAHTLRIAWPQIEQGTFPSSPILPVNSLVATNRPADQLTAPLASLAPNGACTVVWSGVVPVEFGDTLFQLDDGTNNNRVLMQTRANGAFVEPVRVVGGNATLLVDVGSMTPGQPFAVGLSLNADGRILAAMKGGTVRFSSGTLPPGLTTLRIGSDVGGGFPMFGEVGWLDVYRAALGPDDLLAALAAIPL